MEWNPETIEAEQPVEVVDVNEDGTVVVTEPKTPIPPPEGFAEVIKEALTETTEATEKQPDEQQPTERSESDELLDQMWNCELAIRAKESHLEELKEEVKEVKASLDVAIKRLRQLSQAKHENRPLFPAVNQPGESAQEPNLPPPEPTDEWKSESIKVLITPPIAGMGNKKIEALIDEVPTLGDFEKLRSQVGRDADHLSKLLPKGFGEKLTDELEERQLDFIANFQPGDSATESPTEPQTESPSNETDDLTPEERQLLTRLAELDRDGDSDGDWMDVRNDPEIWGAGFEAGNAGEEIGECIYTAGENQDDWLRGWASANSEWEDVDDGDDGEATDEPDAEQPVESTPTTTDTTDELADL